MKIQASKIRKGALVRIKGTLVKVRKREKWTKLYVKVHFEDCGYGLPHSDCLYEASYEFEVL